MRRALLTVVLVLLAVPLLGWLALARQARRLGEALVADARALEARRFTLTSSPRKGPVLECLGPLADVAPEVRQLLARSSAEVQRITDGTLPRSALEPALEAETRAAEPWLRQVVACAELDELAPTDGLGPFPDQLHGRRQSKLLLFNALCTLAPLSIRQATHDGHADEALATCGAVFLHGAAIARLEAFEGLLPGLQAFSVLRRPCADAFAAASSDARARFTRVATETRALLPGFDELIALDRTQKAIELFGAWLPRDLDAQLPEGARRTTARRRLTPWVRGVVGTLALRLSWRRFDRALRAVEAAARLAPPAQGPALEAAEQELKGQLLDGFLAAPMVDPQFHAYAGYVPSMARTLDDLLATPATTTGANSKEPAPAQTSTP